MAAIHSNTIKLYNNNKKKKSLNIHQQKTLTLNPNPSFDQVKLEN